MAVPVAEWVSEQVEPVRDQPAAYLNGQFFHRDPPRAVFVDSEVVMAPADGTIVRTGRFRPSDTIGVKGGATSIADLLGAHHPAQEYLAIGIFLSFYDVHVLRAPISAWVTHHWAEPIQTANASMLEVETALLDDGQIIEGAYYANERVVSTFRTNERVVHVVQIADAEVDHVLPFSHRPTTYGQAERFSLIRFGSHCEVLIPLDCITDYELVHEPGIHVEAGVDPIVRLIRGKSDLGNVPAGLFQC